MSHSFEIPGLGWRETVRRANQDNYFTRSEMHGPTYRLEMSEQRQEGDPQQIALREPSPYEHPEKLGTDVLEPGGPRVLPVSQMATHGPQLGRSDAFVMDDPVDLALLYTAIGWKDRRVEKRRYSYTNWQREAEEGPQPSNRVTGLQTDLPFQAWQRGW
jgi:hypothetical protein